MNKPFLLIAGDSYYPQAGTDDWQGRFDSIEEIQKAITTVEHHKYFTKGKNKGNVKSTYYHYEYNGDKYDWYQIVDLTEWE